MYQNVLILSTVALMLHIASVCRRRCHLYGMYCG